MGKLKNSVIDQPSGGDGGGPGIHIGNYVKKFQDFIRFKGGMGAVIRTYRPGQRRQAAGEDVYASFPLTEAQWFAWMNWFAKKGIPTKAANAHGLMTVPTEWPEDFDPDAVSSDKYWQPPPVLERATPEQRAEMIRRYQDLLATLGSPDDPHEIGPRTDARRIKDRDTRSNVVAYHEKRLEEMRFHNETHPITVTPEMMGFDGDD